MAFNKKKIIIYADWINNFEELTDTELGILFRHFFDYVNDKNPVLKDRLIKVAWKPIEATLKRDLKNWNEKAPERVNKARVAGLASAEKRKQLNSTKSNSVVKKQLNSTVSVSVSDSDSDSDSVKVTVRDNVILKEIEIENLTKKFGYNGYNWMLDKLSNYKLSNGKTYKSDYGAINSWVVKEWKKEKENKNLSPMETILGK